MKAVSVLGFVPANPEYYAVNSLLMRRTVRLRFQGPPGREIGGSHSLTPRGAYTRRAAGVEARE